MSIGSQVAFECFLLCQSSTSAKYIIKAKAIKFYWKTYLVQILNPSVHRWLKTILHEQVQSIIRSKFELCAQIHTNLGEKTVLLRGEFRIFQLRCAGYAHCVYGDFACHVTFEVGIDQGLLCLYHL